MAYLLNIISLFVLFTCFALISSKYIKSYIRIFRLQSLFIAIATWVISLGITDMKEKMNIIIVFLVIFILKVLYIPYLLQKTSDGVNYKIEKDYFFNIPLLVLISCGLVIFSYFTIAKVIGSNSHEFVNYIIDSISVILIGFLFMMSRKKAIGQIVGFLVMENGLFITALFATHGMPLIVDLGIFIDLVMAVLVMGMMVFNINEKFESIDVNKLKRLRG